MRDDGSLSSPPAVTRAPRRAIAAGTAALLVATIIVGADASSALADTAPPTSSIPATVSSDALPTPQIDGVVWDQQIVGDTVFVGGSFSTARPAGGQRGCTM